MVSKSNVPYYMAGTLATFTLLASGVFAAAPYIGFLAPAAALSIGLPFIIGSAVLSAVVIALSAVAISKNNTISQQKKFESRVAKRKQEEENARARLKAKDLLPIVILLPYRNLEVLIAERKQEEEGALKDEGLLPRVILLQYKSIESYVAQRKRELENARAGLEAKGVLPNVPYKNVEASSPENQPAKEGNGQSWCARVRQNRFKIGAVAGVTCLVYIAANVGLDVACNSSSIVSNPVNSTENGGFCVADNLFSVIGNFVNSAGNDTLNLSSTCPNPTMQHPDMVQCKIYENFTKLANAEKWYNDILSLNLSSTYPNPTMQRPYNNVEASSPENQLAKEGNGQSWGAFVQQTRSNISGGIVAVGGIVVAIISLAYHDINDVPNFQ